MQESQWNIQERNEQNAFNRGDSKLGDVLLAIREKKGDRYLLDALDMGMLESVHDAFRARLQKNADGEYDRLGYGKLDANGKIVVGSGPIDEATVELLLGPNNPERAIEKKVEADQARRAEAIERITHRESDWHSLPAVSRAAYRVAARVEKPELKSLLETLAKAVQAEAEQASAPPANYGVEG